jgi:hypothetical protein
MTKDEQISKILANYGFGGTKTRRVTKARMQSAINTLGDLTTEDRDELDGKTRDEISHVIHVLNELIDG